MVAFDLATSGDFKDICYGVIVDNDTIKHYVSRKEGQMSTPLLHPVLLTQMLIDLNNILDKRRVFGWGSLGYDCRLLYDETTGKEEALNLAYNHMDLMWLLAIYTGQYISLAEIGAFYGVYVDPKLSRYVPSLWKANAESQERVVEHHTSCALAISKAAHDYMSRSKICWIDKKSGKNCSWFFQHRNLALSHKELLEYVLRVPGKGLSKYAADTTNWLREVICATSSKVQS